jgi:hypothetical protein
MIATRMIVSPEEPGAAPRLPYVEPSSKGRTYELLKGTPLVPSGLPQRLVLEACDFVLYQQLAAFQLNDLEIVDPRMSTGFGNLRFQGPMPLF